MSVIPEKTLFSLLRSCLELSRRALEQIDSAGAIGSTAPDLLDDYATLIRSLHQEKRNDFALADESWEWIWEVKREMNPIQLYGRLAWINYNLISLL